MNHYIVHYNKNKTQYSVVDNDFEQYQYITYDLNELIECPNCHKKIKAGKAYTSQFWFDGSKTFGIMICKDCHDEENKIILEEKKRSQTTTKKEFLISKGYYWNSVYRYFSRETDKFRMCISIDEKEEKKPFCKVVSLIHFYEIEDIEELAKALREVGNDFRECLRYKQ